MPNTDEEMRQPCIPPLAVLMAFDLLEKIKQAYRNSAAPQMKPTISVHPPGKEAPSAAIDFHLLGCRDRHLVFSIDAHLMISALRSWGPSFLELDAEYIVLDQDVIDAQIAWLRGKPYLLPGAVTEEQYEAVQQRRSELLAQRDYTEEEQWEMVELNHIFKRYVLDNPEMQKKQAKTD